MASGDEARAAREVEVLAQPATDAQQEALDRARSGASELATNLRARLMEAMAQGGPPAAIRVCADEAQGIGAQAGATHQARVGRATDRPRNPVNAGPDWAVAWLEAQKERPAEEVQPAEGIVSRPDGEVAVVMRPIRIEAPCVTCHGPKEGIPDEVQAVLAERYPQDQATGYAVGDLRGVLWAEAAVP